MLARFQSIEDAIDVNAELANSILKTGFAWAGVDSKQYFGLPPDTLSTDLGGMASSNMRQDAPQNSPQRHPEELNLPQIPAFNTPARFDDFSKAASTLRQLYREWSVEGSAERRACFNPVLAFLEAHFAGTPPARRRTVRVLNPGCGLGRLVFELALRGFAAEGCELSYHQTVTAMHVMNATEAAEEALLHPWVLGGANHLCHEDRVRAVRVPDVCPREELARAVAGFAAQGGGVEEEASAVDGEQLGDEEEERDRLAISSGDFSVVYRRPKFRRAYDAVATVFFLDTAPNAVAYVETVRSCLREGGVWVNLGPLKWHWENITGGKTDRQGYRPDERDSEDLGVGNPGQVELTEEDIVALLRVYGFEMLAYEKSGSIQVGYVHNPRSMEVGMYYPSFWVARKKGSDCG